MKRKTIIETVREMYARGAQIRHNPQANLRAGEEHSLIESVREMYARGAQIRHNPQANLRLEPVQED